jgi:type III secretory pathway component EscS
MPESATTPTRYSNTVKALVVSMVMGLPALLDKLQALNLPFPAWVVNTMIVVSVLAAWLSPMLARHSAMEGLQAVEAKVATVAETTAAVVDPHTETPEGAAETLRAVAESSKP